MVLVCHSHKFIFLKSRKTAGTSAEMFLEPACAPKGHIVQESVKALITKEGIIGSRMSPCKRGRWRAMEKGRWCNHKPARAVLRDLGAERFYAYSKITTIRNPFDRCVSAFHWSNKALLHMTESFAQMRVAFRDYIHSAQLNADVSTVFVKDKYIIDRAIRFEHLAADLEAVAGELGLPAADDRLPHTKSSAKTRKDYAVEDYYDQATIDIVRQRHSWVFERYDYPDHPQTSRSANHV